ncbi:MAG: hypothetical protein U5Q03_04430 [Bacteroidota bacterium]|nr:hypothetical protein [Bacteroidota bacterium]
MKNPHCSSGISIFLIAQKLKYFSLAGIALIIFNTKVSAQDLVVWNTGDSLNCKITKEFDEYMKELRSGLHFGLEASCYFNETYGIGIAFSSFHTENEIKFVEFYLENGNTITGTYGDDGENISRIDLSAGLRLLL